MQPTQLAALDWAASAAGTLGRPWKVGSIVSGRVLEYMSRARLVLQIDGLTVQADAPSSGSVPRQFQARVLGNGAQPVLELVGQTASPSPLADALRSRLPRQGGLQPLLADLHALARTPGARALPEPVRVALARLEASVADRHDIFDPDILRDTLKRSGLQLEHTLLQGLRAHTRSPTTPIDYDLKAALQRLTQALQRLPAPSPSSATPPASTSSATYAPAPTTPPAVDTHPPLLHLPLQAQARLPATPAVDAASLASSMLGHALAVLSRIEIMQLEAHPTVSPQAWMIEVPVRGDDGFDVVQVRIEQDAGGAQGEAIAHWTLGFTLEPPGLGAVHGRLRLRHPHVDVDLWAQHDAGVHALEEQTAVLARILDGSGLQLQQLRVRQGTPMRHTGLARTLLDASA